SAPLREASPAVAPRARAFSIRGIGIGVAAIAAAVVGIVGLARRGGDGSRPVPTVAVGHFRDYTKRAGGVELSEPLTDMLAPNLARAPGLQVVSTARLLELMAHDVGAHRDTTAAAMSAARQAGATQLIDGAVYARDNGGYRLDLRATDIATGKVIDSYT